jgi:hypothetical protein
VKPALAALAGLGAALGFGCTGDDLVIPGPLEWPNEISSANSDRWLVEHHDRIEKLRPRVMVLHFFNGMTVEQARAVAENEVAAIREGSRYHGYADPSAPAYIEYQVARVVDLTDHPVPDPRAWPHPSSTLVPATPSHFGYAELFTQRFADYYGFTAPQEPARNLTLCELFETGAVNEVWLLVGEDLAPRRPRQAPERKQVYDDLGNAIPGRFDLCAGNQCFTDEDAVTCRVSVRLFHLNPNAGPGCDLHVYGNAFESILGSIPYLAVNASSFLNFDFRSRFSTRFNSWYEACLDTANTPCIAYPTPTVATGVYGDRTRWRIDPFLQGCGNVHFPPNARGEEDYENRTPVQSRCEHFGMRDGPDGQDLPDVYTADKVEEYDRQFRGCGGGWQVYWRQNFPGFANKAHAADGRPMKNWWPFLFY